MQTDEFDKSPRPVATTLVVRRIIRASAQYLFDVWTQPEHLKQWWGPANVTCIDASLDLRIGGGYRLGNRLPDGTVVLIAGQFEAIDAAQTRLHLASGVRDARCRTSYGPVRAACRFHRGSGPARAHSR